MTESAREKLARLAQEIDDLVSEERRLFAKRPFPPTISFDLADWFTAAVRASAEGKVTLDKALGLSPGRGRPKQDSIPTRAREIFYLRLPMGFPGKAAKLAKAPSWKTLADRYSAEPRDLQREQKTYEARLVQEFAAELGERLRFGD